MEAVDRHQEIGQFSDLLFGAEEAFGQAVVVAQGRLQRIGSRVHLGLCVEKRHC